MNITLTEEDIVKGVQSTMLANEIWKLLLLHPPAIGAVAMALVNVDMLDLDRQALFGPPGTLGNIQAVFAKTGIKRTKR